MMGNQKRGGKRQITHILGNGKPSKKGLFSDKNNI